MVIDTLDHSSSYENLHPRFKAAFAFLKRPDIATVALGRTDIDGNSLYALVQEYETKPIQEGKLEAHKKYVDIQMILEGEEFMGYAPLGGQTATKPFDPDKDIGFFDGEAWFTRFRKGMFAIFFPQDAHLPGRYTEKPSAVKKIVLKIQLSE